METVHNVEEAEKFFGSNEGVEVICENEDKVTKVVSSLADAQAFFTEGDEVTADAEVATDATDADVDADTDATGTDTTGSDTAENAG